MTVLHSTVDEIGYWTELKLEMISKYAKAYSRILSTRFYHVYIDAFAGAGMNISRTTGDIVKGSSLNALTIDPPFREYFLVDLSGDKVEHLRELIKNYPNSADAHLFRGDCNQVLLKDVFPRVSYSDYRRGLCLLDPYGMHFDWNVIQTAGRMKSIDMLLNFPIHDIRRNALRKDPTAEGIKRMSMLWGDETWRTCLFEDDLDLFDSTKSKSQDREVLRRFTDRLTKVAGFKCVSNALPLRNSRGSVLFYMMLASQQSLAGDIVNDIVQKYWDRGIR